MASNKVKVAPKGRKTRAKVDEAKQLKKMYNEFFIYSGTQQVSFYSESLEQPSALKHVPSVTTYGIHGGISSEG